MIEVRELYLDGGRLFSDARFCITDTKTPVFSWSCVSDTDGDKQTAYRAQAALGKTLLWDSGWVETSEQSCVYAGKALPAGRYLDFMVSVRNTHGEESDTFGGQFVCGALTEDAWKGKWITPDENTGAHAAYFRRDFRIEKELAAACLFVCGIGYHRVTVNGMDVDDAMLDPVNTNPDKTCYYAVLPNVGEFLEAGENCIGVIVAPSEMTCENTSPKLLAQLHLFYSDGTKQCMCTDEKWKWKLGGITETHLYSGECYDANASDPLWDQPLDEGEQAYAAELLHDVALSDVPIGTLRAMSQEPIRMRETYAPRTMTEPVRNTFVVDFGQRICGAVRILLPARMKRGQVVSIRYADAIDAFGGLIDGGAVQNDTYVASGDDRDLTVWQTKFTCHAFRYVEIHGLSLFDRHNILAAAIYHDIKSEVYFDCSDSAANAAQDAAVMAEKAMLHTALTDMGSHLYALPYHFGIGRLFTRSVRDFLDLHSAHAESGSAAAVLSTEFLIAGWLAYLHTGNTTLLAQAFDGFAALERSLFEYALAGGTDLADCSAALFACFSYFRCAQLARMARILARPEDEAQFARYAERIRSAFLEKWYDAQSTRVGCGTVHEMTAALWCGILPEDGRAAAASRLHEETQHALHGNPDCSCAQRLCAQLLPIVLTENGYAQSVWNLASEGCHQGGALGAWFYAGLCGITPIESGFTRTVIRPCYPEGVQYAQCAVDTVKGQLSVSWRRDGGQIHLCAVIPFGVTAEITTGDTLVVCGSGTHCFVL